MKDPPVEIHIEENASPTACNTPAPVALHWQDQVYRDLILDEKFGVSERVPHNEPSEWYHRMVIARKESDGKAKLRRTVDLSRLN